MEITPLKFLTYSLLLNNIDQSKEKNVKSKYTFLNLKKLVENFELDNSSPAFIGKSYYQNNPEFSYNYPPKGPIPNYFECVYCEQEGPDFHLANCKRPFDSSLILTESGENKYKRNAGTSYAILVKKRGQKKIISTSVKNQKFSDNVELVYENENKAQTIIKIGKNGVINIISANFESSKKKMIDKLIQKINDSDSLVNITSFKIDDSMSYTYLILAQFNLYSKENKEINNFVDLENLNTILWETPLVKHKIKGNTVFKYSSTIYPVHNYRYNSGNITSRSNKQTNPFIQFDLHDGVFKIGILIYKRGGVQMRLSYIDKNTDKNQFPLNTKTLEDAYIFLRNIFNLFLSEIILTEEAREKKGITNMVDGGQPKVCQDRKGHELRPRPYSFYGKCPMENYYVRPEGKKRPDGKYEPCCYKLKDTGKDSLKTILNTYKEGYTVPEPDTLSAVFIPGTKIIESRGFKGLTSLSEKQLIDSIESLGYISSFKKDQSVLDKYNSLTGHSDLLFQYPSEYNKEIKYFIVTPIDKNAERVLLFFDNKGYSYFINESKRVNESGIDKIKKLNDTIMDGYYLDNTFYPIDIIFYNGENISNQVFKNRFQTLMFSLELLNEIDTSLNIVTNFDDSISNLKSDKNDFILFISLNSVYTIGKKNKDVLVKFKDYISFNVEHVKENRWKISIDGKAVPESEIPQVNNTIKLPVIFTNKNEIEDNDIILFKINYNSDGIINNNKPLVPIQKIDNHIN